MFLDPVILYQTEKGFVFRIENLYSNTGSPIYRKLTHTDLYLNFDSNHHLEHKRSIVRTLFHWARTVITEDQNKETEMNHLRSVLQNNNYKPWIFKTPLGTTHKPKGTANKGGSSISVPLPYMQGVSEQLTRVFRKQGVSTYHRACKYHKTTAGTPQGSHTHGKEMRSGL